MENITRANLEALQLFMQPHSRKFTIIQILQHFPKDPAIHLLFKDICIYFQTPMLTYQQLNHYALNSLNRSFLIQSNKNVNFINQNERIYIRQLNNGQLDYHVYLLNDSVKTNDNINVIHPRTSLDKSLSKTLNTNKDLNGSINKQKDKQKQKVQKGKKLDQRVKDLIIDNTGENSYEKILVVTHKCIKHFSCINETFIGSDIKIEGNSIVLATLYEGVMGILTYNNKFYIQVDNLALNSNTSIKNKTKINLVQCIAFSFNRTQKIMQMFALSEFKWVFITKQVLWIITFDFKTSEQLSHVIKKISLFKPEQNKSILKVSMVKNKYILVLTSDKSLIIFDTESYQISNVVYNDTVFLDICYNQQCDIVVVSDYAGFLITMCFNQNFGDTQQQGISYKKTQKMEQILVQNKKSKKVFKLFEKKQKVRENKIKPELICDPPLSKQRKTPYTVIIQNNHKRKLEIVRSKEKSILTYQNLGQKMIKIWDISTMRVYQKIPLNMDIQNMKLSSQKLFLISSQKGYLSCYNFQKNMKNKENKKMFHVTNAQNNSNSILMTVASMKETYLYKLKLGNQPVLYNFHTLAFEENNIKSVFFKDQIYILNTTNPQKHKFATFGGFGDRLQTLTRGYNEYNNIINIGQNKIILWGPTKITIQGKNKNKKINNLSNDKKDKIYSNTIDVQEGNDSYKDHILFSKKQISNVKYYSGYVLVKIMVKDSANIYLIDQKMLTISLILLEMPSNYRIVTPHKDYILLQNKDNSQVQLYDINRAKTIWKSQFISGWSIYAAQIIYVSKSNLKIVVTLKSENTTLSMSQPIFMISQILINCQNFSAQKFIDLSDIIPKYDKTSQQFYSFEQIQLRSLPNKIRFNQILDKDYRKYVESVKYSKIFFQQYYRPIITKMNEGQISRIQGKMLASSQDTGLIFCLMSGSTITFYNASIFPFAQFIGTLDFNTGKQKVQNQDIIVDWNQNYKKQEQEEWDNVKKNIGRYLTGKKKKKITPLLIQKNKLNNEQIQSPLPSEPSSPFKFRRFKTDVNIDDEENQLQKLLIGIPEKIESQKQQNFGQLKNPKAINNLLYKNYIQNNIKQEEQVQKKQTKLKRSLKQDKKYIKRNDVQKIKKLTTTFTTAKMDLNSETPLKYKAEPSSVQQSNYDQIQAFTPNKTKSLSRKINSLTNIKTKSIQKKMRYETEATDQITASKQLSKLYLPLIQTVRTQNLKNNTTVKNIINDQLKKQQLTMSLMQSRRTYQRKLF